MAKRPRISNPYSTGGGGYDFEHLVGTYYLISMLKKSIPLGIEEGIIEQVKFQAKYNGHFLDDIVLICSNDCSISIQVRKKVKFTENAPEFKSLIIECFKNFNKEDFNPNSDRNCIVVGTHHNNIPNLKQLSKIAETSINPDEFKTKTEQEGFISKKTQNLLKGIKKIIEEYIKSQKNKAFNDNDLWNFIKSLIILKFDIENISGIQYNQCLNGLKELLKDNLDGIKLFSFLKSKVAEYDKYGGTFQYDLLLMEVSRRFKLKKNNEINDNDYDYGIMRELFFNKDFDGSEEYLKKLIKLNPTNFELKIYSAFINFRKSLFLPNNSDHKRSFYVTFGEELNLYAQNYFYNVNNTLLISSIFFEFFPILIHFKNFFSDHNIVKIQMNRFLWNTLEAYIIIDYRNFNDFIERILITFQRDLNNIDLLIIGYYKAVLDFYYEKFEDVYPIFYEILSKCSIKEAQEFVFELRIPIFIIIIDICRGKEPELNNILDLIRSTMLNPIIKHLSRKPIHIFEDATDNVFSRIKIFQNKENKWKINLNRLVEQLTPYIDKIKNTLIAF